MKIVFVDTSGWGNLADSNQPFHSQAQDIYRQAKSGAVRFVTSNYVLAELVALLSSPMRISRGRSIKFITSIKTSALVDIVHIDSNLDERSWDFLLNRADKDWSLVDCSSFVIMREAGVIESLTTDHHFEQAGFVRLLK